jgi:hypothetical protein
LSHGDRCVLYGRTSASSRARGCGEGGLGIRPFGCTAAPAPATTTATGLLLGGVVALQCILVDLIEVCGTSSCIITLRRQHWNNGWREGEIILFRFFLLR